MLQSIFYHLNHILVASAWGAMLFFGAVMAPLIFKHLPTDTSGPFIRQVFPVYYLVLSAICGLAAVSVLLTDSSGVVECVLLILVTLGFLYARQLLMPRINQLRDAATAGDETAQQPFERSHRFSVWLNGVQMIVLLAVLVRLAS